MYYSDMFGITLLALISLRWKMKALEGFRKFGRDKEPRIIWEKNRLAIDSQI